jgi:cardiolipin synthase
MAACIAAATRTLHVTNAYFVPTPAFVEALSAARERGVDVKVVVPGPYHNKPFVRRASRHSWKALIASGVEIHEFQPSMVHAKTLTVDGAVALVGSINFDPRSFSLNAECGIVAADAGLAGEMDAVFAADLARCRRITPEDVDSRPLGTRAIDALCYWLRAQL